MDKRLKNNDVYEEIRSLGVGELMRIPHGRWKNAGSITKNLNRGSIGKHYRTVTTHYDYIVVRIR